MFQLIKKVFSALLSFSGSLAAKCMSLKNKSCITRPTFIERTYYSFIIGTDNCNENVNTLYNRFGKICALNRKCQC